MELAYAFLADAAQFTPDGKLNMLGGDFGSIGATAFPYVHPIIAVVTRFRIDRAETGVEHPVTIQLRYADRLIEEPIAQVQGTFPPADVPPTAPGPFHVANVSHLMMAVFPEAGNYLIRITADGRQMADLPLTVGQPAAPQEGEEE